MHFNQWRGTYSSCKHISSSCYSLEIYTVYIPKLYKIAPAKVREIAINTVAISFTPLQLISFS